jgi:WhiB family transcriptional regulator, redox-sensing transcriptional regulator
MEWLRYAACAGEDPELFFPVGSTGPAVTETADAKRVCRSCPVIGECLDWALSSGQTTGVWGGTDERERAVMFRSARDLPRGRGAR